MERPIRNDRRGIAAVGDEAGVMRMTDETPGVNHSFAPPAYVIFRQTKPHVGSAIG